MATALLKRPATGDNRIHFCASWDLYQTLSRSIGDQGILVSYDGERVELMSPGAEHESYKPRMHRLIAALAEGLDMLCLNIGSNRWNRPEAMRGLEADEAFYFSEVKIQVAKQRLGDPAAYPIPDLAVEIDISPSQIDRPAIYAALGIPEVWRFDGDVVRIDRLGPDGTFTEATESGLLGITPAEVLELLEMEFRDHNDFARKVTAWAIESLRPRRSSWMLP